MDIQFGTDPDKISVYKHSKDNEPFGTKEVHKITIERKRMGLYDDLDIDVGRYEISIPRSILKGVLDLYEHDYPELQGRPSENILTDEQLEILRGQGIDVGIPKVFLEPSCICDDNSRFCNPDCVECFGVRD